MFKDFFKWHSLKAKIDTSPRRVFFHPQEIWWCSIGANIGVEENGKHTLFERPVLVFRKFNKHMFWGLPLTSKIKKDQPFHFTFSLHQKSQTALLSQMRVLSSKRLIRNLGKISDAQMTALNKAIMHFITETDPLRGPRGPNGHSAHHAIRRK